MRPAKPVVLLIDRDLPMLELYQRELSQDYQVLTCADEKTVLTLLTTPNLVALVLEPAIASGEGWDLLAAILHTLQEKPVPVVVCSTLDERKRGMEAGAAAFLIKPVLPAHLRDTLHQVIKSWCRVTSFSPPTGNRLNVLASSIPVEETTPSVESPMNQETASPILQIRNLKTSFFLEKGTVRAVDGVDLTLKRKSTLGLVGESGCGKTVTAMSVMRLIQSPPGKIVAGQIELYSKDGEVVDLVQLDPHGPKMRSIRGAEIAMVFQEPMTSLNPLYSVGQQIAESIRLHQKASPKEALERALEMLYKVQISEPRQRLHAYPHQLSGGMRQRVMIGLALSCNPSILIADEPTTALDMTVQAQILDLMRQLQEDINSSILLITHNLGVVSQMADEVTVMYLGKVVEHAPVRELFHHPLHPYTVGLLNSVPVLGRKGHKVLVPIRGMVPTPTHEIQGCAFAPRCPRAMGGCRPMEPTLREAAPGHTVACWLYGSTPAHR